MFDVHKLLNDLPYPDDVTVWDLRVQLVRGDLGKWLLVTCPSIRDPGVDLFRRDGSRWPDEMTLATLRAALEDGELLHISFRDGGLRQDSNVRPRELV